MHVVLDTADAAVALRTVDPAVTASDLRVPVPAPDLSLEHRLVEHLAAATTPTTATTLRRLCQVRNTALHHALATLVAAGRVRKDRAGYALAR